MQCTISYFLFSTAIVLSKVIGRFPHPCNETRLTSEGQQVWLQANLLILAFGKEWPAQHITCELVLIVIHFNLPIKTEMWLFAVITATFYRTIFWPLLAWIQLFDLIAFRVKKDGAISLLSCNYWTKSLSINVLSTHNLYNVFVSDS